MNRFNVKTVGKALLMLTAAVAVGLSGCGGDKGAGGSGDDGRGGGVVAPNTVVKSTFTDSRNGQTYKTVKIGSQTWMAENLNYTTADSWCYGEDGDVYDSGDDYIALSPSEIRANCNKYGRLYTWAAARTACPSGWHLPSREEWLALIKAAGGRDRYEISDSSGMKLKSMSGWGSDSRDNGTDEYGFSALPGGFRGYDGLFRNVGYDGFWWTATVGGRGDAYYQDIYYAYIIVEEGGGDDVDPGEIVNDNGYSVRCVKN